MFGDCAVPVVEIRNNYMIKDFLKQGERYPGALDELKRIITCYCDSVAVRVQGMGVDARGAKEP